MHCRRVGILAVHSRYSLESWPRWWLINRKRMDHLNCSCTRWIRCCVCASGTSLMSENAILDLPTAVVAVYMDTNEPRTPGTLIELLLNTDFWCRILSFSVHKHPLGIFQPPNLLEVLDSWQRTSMARKVTNQGEDGGLGHNLVNVFEIQLKCQPSSALRLVF